MNKKNYRQALIERVEVPVKQDEIMVGSINTSFLSAGSGKPVILLHGGGAGAVTWYPSIGPMARDFHVIAPDIVGYGESDKPDAAYDKNFFVSWLKHFLLELKIPKAHIVGLSQGGAIALKFAIEYPEMVDKLVLVDSGAVGAKPPLLSIVSMIWLNLLPSALANHVYSRFILYKPENRDPNHARYSIEVLKRKGGKNAFKQGQGSAVSALSKTELSKIQNNTLVIWGENDRLFPVEYGANVAMMMPNAVFLKIKHAGHLPLMEQPDIFNKAVSDFLNTMEVTS